MKHMTNDATTTDETAGTVELVDGEDVSLLSADSLKNLAQLEDPCAYATCNLLVGNEEYSPLFEVKGRARFYIEKPLIAAVTGKGSAEVVSDGESIKVELWKAIPIPPKSYLVVKGPKAYVSFSKLKANGRGKIKPKSFFKVSVLNGGIPKDIIARYLPLSFFDEIRRIRQSADDRIKNVMHTINKIKRHLQLSCEAAARGAKLVRVNVQGTLMDVWIEEIQ